MIKYTVKLKVELETPETISYNMYDFVNINDNIVDTKYTYKKSKKIGDLTFDFTDVISNKFKIEFDNIDSELYNITNQEFNINKDSSSIVENTFVENFILSVEIRIEIEDPTVEQPSGIIFNPLYLFIDIACLIVIVFAFVIINRRKLFSKKGRR